MKTKKNVKFCLTLGLMFAVVFAAIPGMSVATAACPPQGSGAAGVLAWAAANCGDGDCVNPATTCNGEFTIELIDVEEDGDLVTFVYEVCQIAGQNALSHWVISLAGIDCFADGFNIEDLVVGATLNDIVLIEGGIVIDEENRYGYVVGLDPTTQLFGIKFDEGVDKTPQCNEFTVTFDTSVLNEGWTLGVGCTLAATKAGNQDIRPPQGQAPLSPTPGYACIAGPVCVEDEVECQYQTETAWGGNSPGGGPAWWFFYNGGEQTIYAGQTIEVGTVEVDDDGCMIITLNDGWELQDGDETVKIQGYNTLPTRRPAAGLFTTYKGTELEICEIGDYALYAIHLDVQKCIY